MSMIVDVPALPMNQPSLENDQDWGGRCIKNFCKRNLCSLLAIATGIVAIGILILEIAYKDVLTLKEHTVVGFIGMILISSSILARCIFLTYQERLAQSS